MRAARRLAALCVLVVGGGASAASAEAPETIRFPSTDGTTSLVGFLFLPDDPGRSKQRRDANRRATEDARARTARFFDANLKRRPD